MQIGCFQHGIAFIEWHICIMRRLLLMLMIVFFQMQAHSQLIDVREISTLAYEKELNDAIIGNRLVAIGAKLSSPVLGLQLSNKYSIKEATAAALATVIPFKNNSISIGAATEGISSFRVLSFNSGYAMKIFEQLTIGMKLIGTGMFIKGSNNHFHIGYQLGMAYQLSPATRCQFHFSNHRPIHAPFNENLQGTYEIQAGCAQQMNEDLLLSCDIHQTKGSSVSISPGFIWSVKKQIQLLGGLIPLPGEVFMGIGWWRNSNRMMFIISHHPFLGNSFTIKYNIIKQ